MPSAATRSLLLFGKKQETLDSYLATLPFLALYKMQQTSGTNEPNSGSLGAAVDMTITSTTLGQTGQLGPNEAYLLDGASSRLQTANNATLAGKMAWEFVALVNPSSAGEGTVGVFFCWGNGSNEPLCIFNGSLNAINCQVFNTTPTATNATTNTGLAASTWSLLFVSYDDAGDRKIHLRKGVSGAVTEFGYSTQQTMSGTYKLPISNLNLFNRNALDRTFAGLADFVGIVDGNLTPAQRLKITQLAGV